MEHPDAPSGFVTLYSYKEPFMPFKQGHGFEGVLLFDGKTDKIQCHLCGEWMAYLPNHLKREHAMRASEYKELVGLRQTTALISEKQRAKLIEVSLDKRKANLKKGRAKTEEEKEKIRQTLKNFVREAQNERGTCPEQLLDRLRKKHEESFAKHGRAPTKEELGDGLTKTIIKIHGSMKRACELAGVDYRRPGVNIGKDNNVYSREDLIQILIDFEEREGRQVSWSDIRRKLVPSSIHFSREFKTLKNAKRVAHKEKLRRAKLK